MVIADHARLARRALPIAAATALAGCAPTPHVATIPVVQSTEWRGTASVDAPDRLAAAFGVPALARLTEQALARNADLGAATARIEQARAQLRIARAAMSPVVTATGGASATRSDGDAATRFESSGFAAGFDVAYEVDLFGRESAGRRAARARASAVAFDRDALALVVEAEVARAVVQHAAATDRLTLLNQALADARELDRIIGVRLRLGEATRLDTGLQSNVIRGLETERLRLVEARERIRNALAVLVGEEAPLFDLPALSLSSFRVPEPAGVQPGALLTRRPDIRAAEARIAAAAGDVERARAAFLPSLSISASALVEGARLGGPVGSLLSVGAGLLAPIFDGGRLRGELAQSAAVQRESVELYRSALLRAFGEAQDALAAASLSRQRERLLAESVTTARETARLSLMRYLEGDSDFQFAADARADIASAEDARAVAKQERLEAAIDLYRAMGGSARDISAAARSREWSQPVTE